MPRSRRQQTNSTAAPAPRGRPRKPREIVNYDQAAFLKHYDVISEKLRLKASADSALSNAYKTAESAGIDRKDLKRARVEADKTADERHRDAEKLQQHLTWLGKPIGTQAEMPLGETAANGADSEQQPADAEAVEKHQNNKAFEEGVGAGKAGAALASCPYQPGTEEYQGYSLGWSAGQKEAVEALGGVTRTAQPN